MGKLGYKIYPFQAAPLPFNILPVLAALNELVFFNLYSLSNPCPDSSSSFPSPFLSLSLLPLKRAAFREAARRESLMTEFRKLEPETNQTSQPLSSGGEKDPKLLLHTGVGAPPLPFFLGAHSVCMNSSFCVFGDYW